MVEGLRTIGRCSCQRVRDRVEIWNRAGVPSRHAQDSVQTWRTLPGTADAYASARAFLDGFPADPAGARGLLFWGEPGRGKTHLLVAVLRELVLARGVAARFIEFSHLLGELREGFSEQRSDRNIMNELAAVPVLAIDELGKGKGSEWELSVIDELISRRYNANGCTLATTNFMPTYQEQRGPRSANLAAASLYSGPLSARPGIPNLGDRVGERVCSRLMEMCAFQQVQGQDYRMMKGSLR